MAFEKDEDKASVETRRLTESVKTIGGTVDGGPARMLVFTIPVSAGFEMVEGFLATFTQELPGTTWWYGNVYEVGDSDRPLNWWKEKVE